MTINVKIGQDIDNKTIYKMTDQFTTRKKLSDLKGQTLRAKRIILYEDVNSNNETQMLTSIETDGGVLVSNSRTVYDSVSGLYAAFGDEMLGYALKVMTGKSKNGREYIWLVADC